MSSLEPVTRPPVRPLASAPRRFGERWQSALGGVLFGRQPSFTPDSAELKHARERWANPINRPSLRAIFWALASVLFLVWAWQGVEADVVKLIREFADARPIVEQFADPDWGVLSDAIDATIVTVQMAIIGIIGATIISIPLGLMAARNVSGNVVYAKFEVGTAFYPEKQQFGCPTGGAGLAIPGAIPDANKVAAMTFIKFLDEPENTAYYSQNVGYMPVRKSAVTGPMAEFLKSKPQFKTAIDQLAKTRAQDSARVYIPGGDAILGKGLERMLLNNEDAKNVWPDVKKELEKAYENDVNPKLKA